MIAIKYYFCCSLLGVLMLTSCNKGEAPAEITYNYLSADIIPFMFKAGSYWIYENDSTAVLDSVVVTSTKQGFFTQPPMTPGTPTNIEIEYFKVNLHSYLTSSDYNDFLFERLITRNGNESPNFGQPIFLSKYSIGFKTYGAQVWDNIDSLSINGIFFYNVEEMKIIHDEQHQFVFSNDTYLYYQDSIGLVKKVIDLGSGNFDSWSLKRWHINF